MGSNMGIFWHGLRRGSGDGVGRGYGGELGHGELGHELMTEVSGF